MKEDNKQTFDTHSIYNEEIKFKLDPNPYVNDLANSQLERLNHYANFFGLNFSVINDTLIISFDTSTMLLKRLRHAGRKHNKNMAEPGITYGDIRRWKADGMTVEEIIKKLHVSRSLYFRRMKEARELSYPDDRLWQG